MKNPPTIIFLGDGMADEPIPTLGGRTPLQAAEKPGMDRIARQGRSGTLLTLPAGFPTSSDVANMSVLGCDLASEFCGRGPLEALARGITLGPGDVCFRLNLVTIAPDGTLADFSGGHISQADADEAIALLNASLASDQVRFFPGVSYRNLLRLSGPEFNADVKCEKPDDHPGGVVASLLPCHAGEAGRRTAETLRNLMRAAAGVLNGREANGIWPWSGGRAGNLRTLHARRGIRGAVISAVDVINGLGRGLGMDIIKVPGATGYIDTCYEAKADAAIAAAHNGYDLVYAHVEAIDEVSHAGDLALKIKAIEDFDRRLVRRVMDALGDGARYAVLPDHPVPVCKGKHTRAPVPVAVCGAGFAPDDVSVFDETAAPRGALGALQGAQFMDILFPQTR